MSEITVQEKVIVHKAAVSISESESLTDFTQQLNDAARNQLVKKTGAKSYDVWSKEVFGDKVVMCAYLVKDDVSTTKHLMMPYTRKDGVFTFGDPVEVRAKTTWEPVVPVNSLSVMVSKSESTESAPQPGQPVRRTRPAPPRPSEA